MSPFADRTTVNDVGTNLHAIDRQATAYERGIAEALTQAGATSTDPVMLVGHSQGGIVAANAAKHFTASGEFAVTHVVTAGSPIGHHDIPDSVQVLSLENTLDVVPQLDAAANPDRPNRVTVRFASGSDPHGIERTYSRVAATLDTSADPSVTAYRQSGSAFFGGPGQAATTYVFELTRALSNGS